MVATAAASAFFPVPSPYCAAKGTKHGNGSVNLGAIKSKSASGKLNVKANAQATPKINGSSSVGSPTTVQGTVMTDDNTPPSPPPRTVTNQFPDWSMLLAAVTTVFLAAEKQWMMLDWKPRRCDMPIDPFGGRIIEDSMLFRQHFSIRTYEIGADRTASIETLMNHFQETGINHVKTAGIFGDGFGCTKEMTKRNLIWVVTKMQVLIDRYPTWGDVVQVDTWVGNHGKNGMRRDWQVRDLKTGDTLVRASSNWVMMNKQTRKLSKLPVEVRGEIGPYFVTSAPAVEEDSRKLPKLDEPTSDYVLSGLAPRWSDLDVNQHVNNVKYISWVLEGAAQRILETHELSAMTLEYRRECGRDSVLKSLSAVSGDIDSSIEVECHHMLQLDTGAEIVRARTEWRPKLVTTCNRAVHHEHSAETA